MKEVIKYIAITIIAICILGLLYRCESTYTREATIIKSENGVVCAVDTTDNLWTYKGDEKVGQRVILTMYDNHTDTIKDDIVKWVKVK